MGAVGIVLSDAALAHEDGSAVLTNMWGNISVLLSSASCVQTPRNIKWPAACVDFFGRFCELRYTRHANLWLARHPSRLGQRFVRHALFTALQKGRAGRSADRVPTLARYALFTVLQKGVLKRRSAPSVTALSALIGGFLIMLTSLGQGYPIWLVSRRVVIAPPPPSLPSRSVLFCTAACSHTLALRSAPLQADQRLRVAAASLKPRRHLLMHIGRPLCFAMLTLAFRPAGVSGMQLVGIGFTAFVTTVIGYSLQTWANVYASPTTVRRRILNLTSNV